MVELFINIFVGIVVLASVGKLFLVGVVRDINQEIDLEFRHDKSAPINQPFPKTHLMFLLKPFIFWDWLAKADPVLYKRRKRAMVIDITLMGIMVISFFSIMILSSCL